MKVNVSVKYMYTCIVNFDVKFPSVHNSNQGLFYILTT